MERLERAVDLRKAIAAFGGFSGLARRLAVPLSTCHGWARRRKLPSWRQEQIKRMAEEQGLDVYKKHRRKKPHHKNRNSAKRRKRAA